MECLEFRRRLLQDPYDNNSELIEHEANCAECAQYSRDVRAQEASLRALLNAPSPPPELAENIRLSTRLEHPVSYAHRAWFAAAASVLLAITISMTSLFDEHQERKNMSLVQNVIHHIEEEANHLHDPGPASPARVKMVLARFGAKLVADPGAVRFAAECVMRKRTGVHLVLEGDQGPVTVFFMPGEQVSEKTMVDSGHLHGEIVPTDWGALAVVGENGEHIAPITQRMAKVVRWPAGRNYLAFHLPEYRSTSVTL